MAVSKEIYDMKAIMDFCNLCDVYRRIVFCVCLQITSRIKVAEGKKNEDRNKKNKKNNRHTYVRYDTRKME